MIVTCLTEICRKVYVLKLLYVLTFTVCTVSHSFVSCYVLICPLLLPLCSPVGLLRPFPCCLLFASLRMSMMSVANSRALKRASFCRPLEREGRRTDLAPGFIYDLTNVVELCVVWKCSFSPHSMVWCLSDYCGQWPCAVEKHSQMNQTLKNKL